MNQAGNLNLSVPGFIHNGKAACSEIDPELFFPQEIEIGKKIVSKYTNLSRAKKVCSECPLVLDCLAYALKNHEIGIWGGTTESQRDSIRRSKKIRTIRRPPSPTHW
jgi:WhiB family transcriptional regulator, redox-sensing transcriptional regulator